MVRRYISVVSMRSLNRSPSGSANLRLQSTGSRGVRSRERLAATNRDESGQVVTHPRGERPQMVNHGVITARSGVRAITRTAPDGTRVIRSPNASGLTHNVDPLGS